MPETHSTQTSAPRSRPLHRPIRFGATLFAVALIAAACSGSDSGPATIKLGQQPLAPGIDDIQTGVPEGATLDVVYDTFDGHTKTLSEYVGTPIVVNFFAASCPTCIAEMPYFEMVHQDLGDSVSFIGLSIDVTAEEALRLIDETGITYSTGWDRNATVYASFGGFVMPTTVFIDASGEIVEVFSGGLSADSLRDKIDKMT